MIKVLVTLFIFAAVLNAQTFTIYNKMNSNLLSNNISAVIVDNNNTKWFGTNEGLSILSDNLNWDSLTVNNGLSSNIITGIASYISRVDSFFVEVSTDVGVNRIKISDNNIEIVSQILNSNSELISDTVRCLSINKNKVHWYGTPLGCSTFDGTEWNQFSIETFYLISNDISDIVSPQNDWTYIATNGDGVARIKQDVDGISSASEITHKWSGLASDSVLTIFIDKLGRRWFGTTKGVSMHFGEKTKPDSTWKTFNSEDGLINNNVTAICEDSVGTMWFGTRQGLSSYNGAEWKSYTTSNGLSGNEITDLAVDKNGDVWVSTTNGITYLEVVTSVKYEQLAKENPKLFLSTYPNPFNMQVQIDFLINNTAPVKLKIFDIQGKEIFSFYEQELSKGKYSVSWKGTDSKNNTVSSGIYICQLISNNQMVSKKLILMK